jgi:hypothetical protein
VIITDSDFTHTGPASPTITILDCGGQITVQNNEITGAGLTILDSSGASTITNNQIHVTGGYSAGINLGSSATATATGNTINAAAGVTAAVTISGMDGTTTFSENTVNATNALFALSVGENRVYVENNGLIAGNIALVVGPMQISGNTLASCFLQDTLGGLINDPVTGNSGLTPFDCWTRCDFDGNGCCDYPPDNNIPGDEGCPCDGVEPPQ